jgi:hypothetical protein
MPNLTIRGNSKARKDSADALLRTYFPNKGDAIAAIDEALQKHNMMLGEFNCPGDEGSARIPIVAMSDYKYTCSACTGEVENPVFDNVFKFCWYRMPSGQYEVTGYIS